ncbi:MAG TPA: tetratricopeptide repeat protein [Anaerolineales bacterium]|jgi:tetratricopeptide (TPR) repeat protein
MSKDNSSPELSPEEGMFQQAVEAIRAEKFAQAREILTKLLQSDQKNPDYWVWLSAAMETQKERLYCLQTAFKLDPANPAVRRGLSLMGALPQDEALKPFPMNHPRHWEARVRQAVATDKPKWTGGPAFRIGAVVGLISLLLVGTVIALGINAASPTATPVAVQGTPRPTVTPYATNSDLALPPASTARPLADLLSTPYTPTPIYAATPHGQAAGDSYRGALRAYKNGQWELMGIMMAQVATAQPGSADALFFIGESKRLSGAYKEAVDYYDGAISVNPKYAPSYLGRARANMLLNPQKDVINDLNEAINLDPGYFEAFMERGMYYFARKDLNSALSDLQQASKLTDSPLVELNLARVLLAQNENSAAVEAAKRANQMDVTMLDGYLVLGMAYRANGQIDQAVDVLETYLQYLPNNAEAFAVLGAAYYNRGDFPNAEKNLTNALRLDSYNADSYFWLGQTYLALKDYDKALTNSLKARNLSPDSFDPAEGLARVYLAKKEFNNSYIAIIKVEKSIETPVQRARFVYIRALSLDQLNQPDAAFRDWSEILKMPVDVTTDEMRQTAQKRVAELRTAIPTITLTPTATATLTPTATGGTGTRGPRPTDTRVPTSTPKIIKPPVTSTPTP